MMQRPSPSAITLHPCRNSRAGAQGHKQLARLRNLQVLGCGGSGHVYPDGAAALALAMPFWYCFSRFGSILSISWPLLPPAAPPAAAPRSKQLCSTSASRSSSSTLRRFSVICGERPCTAAATADSLSHTLPCSSGKPASSVRTSEPWRERSSPARLPASTTASCSSAWLALLLLPSSLSARPNSPRKTISACCSPGSLAIVSITYALTLWQSSGRLPNTCSSSRQSASMTSSRPSPYAATCNI
mmetsp:Transcript_27146/g.80531  ORF Transcript_27146/g.80531 Transcript_27146/m.80531 type:complete len:244 (-) Transcript_27146:1107-1838(-)